MHCQKISFQNTLFENPVLYALTNYDTAWICHCWKNGRYYSFYKTHLATLAVTSRHECFMQEKLFKNEIIENDSQKFHDQW